MIENAIIIVNYNKKELLKRCLTSIFLMNNSDFVVFVVDNGSNDESVEMINNNFSQVRVVKMGYNSGFCKANNIGIQKAIDIGCQNIIILNNDTEVDKLFLSKMVSAINKKNKIEMIAPKVLYFSDRNRIDSAGMLITSDGMAINRLLDKKSEEANDKCEVFCPTGAAALFTADLLNDIKQGDMFFDEDYEYYFEDLDIGWRARLKGWKCMYVPNSIVYHHKNATSGAHSKFIAFYTNRNKFYNIIKNYPFAYCIKALFLAFLRYPLLVLGIVIGRGAVKKFQNNVSVVNLMYIVMLGFRDVIMNFRTLLKQRKNIHYSKKVTNRVIYDWFDKFGVSFLEYLYK